MVENECVNSFLLSLWVGELPESWEYGDMEMSHNVKGTKAKAR